MATALENGKITGVVGIVAAAAYVLCMFTAALLTDGFDFATMKISELGDDMIYIAGCVIAGALGALFGVLVSMRKAKSKTFIEKIRSILMIATGVVLIALGVLDIEGLEWVFIALISLTILADVGYDWVTDQKILMIMSAAFLLIIVLTGILSQGDNVIISLVFALFVAAWVLFVAAMYFAPIAEAPVKGTSKKKENKSKAKKNAPAPRPYPAKRPEAQPKKVEEPKPVVKEQPKKAEIPVAVPQKVEEPKPVVKEQPKVVESQPEPKKVESQPEPKKEELPKLKVMSSREAALARESARKKDPEPEQGLKEAEPMVQPAVESAVEPIAEPMAESAVEPVTVVEDETETEEEYSDEEFEMFEDTPDALLRRATWNKGLRCRRDYGEFQIPIAFVKAKVAVYVVSEFGNTSDDDALKADGWTVFRYLESEITDGKDQAEDINKAVKDNLRAERAAKKKSKAKK
jgi:hypothetical protein